MLLHGCCIPPHGCRHGGPTYPNLQSYKPNYTVPSKQGSFVYGSFILTVISLIDTNVAAEMADPCCHLLSICGRLCCREYRGPRCYPVRCFLFSSFFQGIYAWTILDMWKNSRPGKFLNTTRFLFLNFDCVSTVRTFRLSAIVRIKHRTWKTRLSCTQ